MHNKVRIIGGIYRSRQISVLDETQLRPTPNRIRETLFNWLHDEIAGAQCLDLFAGSGALGFEALSRGAKNVTFVEKNLHILQNLKKNAASLEIAAAEFVNTDALSFLTQDHHFAFDIIFLDPPYAENLIPQCLELLIQQHLLKKGTKIYIEHNQPLNELPYPIEISLIKHKKAGQVYYGLLSVSP